MAPLTLLLFLAGILSVVIGFIQIRKRNLTLGLILIVVGLILIGLPVVLGFLLTLFNPSA